MKSSFNSMKAVRGFRGWARLDAARWAIVPVLLLLVIGPRMIAQERFGVLVGTVTDTSKAPMPGVQVTVTNQDTARSIATKTGGDGSFILRGLEPGRYTARFENQGFTTTDVPDIPMTAGAQLQLNQTLSVAATTETVEVTADAPLIDVSSARLAHNVTAEEFDRLPKSRSFQAMALSSASVNSGEIEGGFQVNGASGAENQFTIDGVSTTSLIDGRSRQNAMYEIIQEVQVKTAGIDAEYGGAWAA